MSDNQIIEANTEEIINHIFPKVERAEYTIEFYCNSSRSMSKPFVGIISFWRGANFLDGSADEGVYLCPKCDTPVRSEAIYQDVVDGKVKNTAICHKCGSKVLGSELKNVEKGRLTATKWAERIYKYFQLFNNDCDLYFKYDKESIIKNYKNWQENNKGRSSMYRDKYVLGQSKKELVIYRKGDLIKDSISGADPVQRIRTFIQGG